LVHFRQFKLPKMNQTAEVTRGGWRRVGVVVGVALLLAACGVADVEIGQAAPEEIAEVPSLSWQVSGELPTTEPLPVVIEPAQPAPRFIVAIDPGHQARGSSTLEPNGPGSANMRARVASGTRGVATGVPEYRLVLDVSLLLRDELVARGYEVVMIRETNDVDISNGERARLANEAGADVFIRMHADGSTDPNVNGILTICTSPQNPYVPRLHAESCRLSTDVLDGMVAATGAHRRGVWQMDNMTGTNWAQMPTVIVEMGLMTNPAEDRLMQTPEHQQLLAQGIADGIDRFFTPTP